MKKEEQVVIIPTDKASASIAYSKQENAYVVASKLRLLEITQGFEVTSLWSWHHLYITDDSEIKEGDWCLFFWDGINKGDIGQVGSEPQQYQPENGHTLNSNLRKIIATTDTDLIGIKKEWEEVDGDWHKSSKLGLPQLQQSFIEEYCKNPVDKVMVEYNEPVCQCDTIEKMFECHFNLGGIEDSCGKPDENNDFYGLRPKLTSNNEIIIHPVKEKMYSRNAMILFAKNCSQHIISKYLRDLSSDLAEEEVDKWIKENLS